MELPYVMISRTTSLDGLIVLRAREFPCLALLKWETIARYGAGADVEATMAVFAERGLKGSGKGD